MSCVLSIIGKNLDPDDLVRKSKLKPGRIFYKGEPVFKNEPNKKRREYSGISIVVSKAEFNDLTTQIKNATSYLKRHKEKLLWIAKTKEVQSARLDFGIESTIHLNGFTQTILFPNSLLNIASELGLELEISLYSSNAG